MKQFALIIWIAAAIIAASAATLQEELKYYLDRHNVQDEGYEMVANYAVHGDTMLTQLPEETMQLLNVGRWKGISREGTGMERDTLGRSVIGRYEADTLIVGIRVDTAAVYSGDFAGGQANGHGCTLLADGTYYEGQWVDDCRHGFGFAIAPGTHIRVGEWKADRYLGERMHYTSERIYGIDISRHQHEKGRKRYSIDWNKVRITSLGARHNAEGRTFPISFVYIKSTEGTNIRNRYFLSDYIKAKKQGIRVGAYHFFSLKSAANAQANYFVNHTLFRKGDFPPVLDVEPSDAQIRKIGGDEELMRRIRIFMDIVERRTGMRPILYISQSFINHHMNNAKDIKQKYNVWIARYGQYKPDVKLVYWQLCPDGKVDGITGDVDINVFNGYQAQFDEFIRTGFHE